MNTSNADDKFTAEILLLWAASFGAFYFFFSGVDPLTKAFLASEKLEGM